MEKYLGVLRKCPLFDGIEDSQLLKMLNCLGARVERFEKKYTVFADGDEAKNIGIVLDGSVRLVQIDYYGNRTILGEFGRSELFCEDFACAGEAELPVSAVANETSDIMLINCRHILHTCHNACGFHHTLIYNLMKDLAKTSIALHRRAQIISKRTTREKLMTYLLLCAKEKGRSSFDIPFDRQELADYLEVDRSGLSVEIGKLRREGVIDCYKAQFTLL